MEQLRGHDFFARRRCTTHIKDVRQRGHIQRARHATHARGVGGHHAVAAHARRRQQHDGGGRPPEQARPTRRRNALRHTASAAYQGPGHASSPYGRGASGGGTPHTDALTAPRTQVTRRAPPSRAPPSRDAPPAPRRAARSRPARRTPAPARRAVQCPAVRAPQPSPAPQASTRRAPPPRATAHLPGFAQLPAHCGSSPRARARHSRCFTSRHGRARIERARSERVISRASRLRAAFTSPTRADALLARSWTEGDVSCVQTLLRLRLCRWLRWRSMLASRTPRVRPAAVSLARASRACCANAAAATPGAASAHQVRVCSSVEPVSPIAC